MRTEAGVENLSEELNHRATIPPRMPRYRLKHRRPPIGIQQMILGPLHLVGMAGARTSKQQEKAGPRGASRGLVQILEEFLSRTCRRLGLNLQTSLRRPMRPNLLILAAATLTGATAACGRKPIEASTASGLNSFKPEWPPGWKRL